MYRIGKTVLSPLDHESVSSLVDEGLFLRVAGVGPRPMRNCRWQGVSMDSNRDGVPDCDVFRLLCAVYADLGRWLGSDMHPQGLLIMCPAGRGNSTDKFLYRLLCTWFCYDIHTSL
jgi:hypothetical protein